MKGLAGVNFMASPPGGARVCRSPGACGTALVSLFLSLFCVVVGGARAANNTAIVDQVAWELKGAGAQIVVVVRGRVGYSSHMASADVGLGLAPRAYVDLSPARLGSQISREPIAVGDALLTRIRIGQFDPQTVRIVVDLERPARFDVQTSSDPPRIVLRLDALAKAPTPAPTVASRARNAAPVEVLWLRKNIGKTARAKRRPVVLATPRGLRSRIKIVVDPGHGGKDPGASGVAGRPEKAITLTIAEQVAEQLAAQPGTDVVLTRTDDSTLTLEQRTAIANAQGADLFISIHANASRNSRARGIETYTLNNTKDAATIRLAAMENGLDLTGAGEEKGDLAFILSDLVQTGKAEESEALARSVQDELVAHLRPDWAGIDDLGVKKGPFYVLVGAYMPCILVETGFLTHREEGRRLATPRYQKAIAAGLAAGIVNFLRSASRDRTL